MTVTVEELGPMVARIAESTPGYADLNLLAQTHTKQRVLDLILPGVETLLAEVNQQIDGIERLGAVKALRKAASMAHNGASDLPGRRGIVHLQSLYNDGASPWLDGLADQIEDGETL